ncbi:hypothetical protein IWQ62_002154 [Dispira parvispora]|uniref:Uncharacterized protein n=1 Tax=Dispira parvispora TaxID=1520584 RepID=A0A9W8AW93_9FUNG|nr:hypothetical protein IWQ62_002154 [Dispira parvispora]
MLQTWVDFDCASAEFENQLNVGPLYGTDSSGPEDFPRGLIAKIVCHSLRTESTPLNATEEIQSLGHEDLLSLCSTELRQLGDLIHQKHHTAIELENKDQVNRQWIDLQKLSGKELLGFSPMFFLTRHDRPAEALLLTKTLHSRGDNVDFLLSANRALGVVAEAYPMYFTVNAPSPSDLSLGRENPLGLNLKHAVSTVFNHNIYEYIFSTPNERVIFNLIIGLSMMGMLKDELTTIYMESKLSLSHIDEKISWLVRNLRATEKDLMSEDDLRISSFFSDSLFYQLGLSNFKNMVAKFQGSAMLYANVKFDSATNFNDMPSKMG